ncbi:unnamed protein product, partial [Laminaria digitata]
MRPSSGGGFVPASRANSRSGGPAVLADASGYGRRRLRTSSSAGTRKPLIDCTLKPPPSPPRGVPPCADIDALEQALQISIRTAGLKPGRENQLADEATRLRRRRKGWLEETEKVIREWAGHAGLLWELHEQELSRLNDDRREKNRQHARTVAVLTKQLGEEREHGGAAAAQERDAAAAQLRAAQEAHELWKKAHQEEIGAAAQLEIVRTTARLRRDADQHAQSIKETLEAEHAARLSSAIEQSEESAAVACAAQERATRLECVTRRLKAQLAEAAERTRRIECLSQTQREALGEVKVDLEKRAQRLARRLEEERASKDQDRIAHESAMVAVRAQWKEELRMVDDRVRIVVTVKDQASSRPRDCCCASVARQRAEMAGALLEELQRGICPGVSPHS